jgi:hypothetical protein
MIPSPAKDIVRLKRPDMYPELYDEELTHDTLNFLPWTCI